MRVREACKILRKHGFRKVRHRGGHRQYRRGKRLVTVAGAHGGKEVFPNIQVLCKRLEGE